MADMVGRILRRKWGHRVRLGAHAMTTPTPPSAMEEAQKLVMAEGLEVSGPNTVNLIHGIARALSERNEQRQRLEKWVSDLQSGMWRVSVRLAERDQEVERWRGAAQALTDFLSHNYPEEYPSTFDELVGTLRALLTRRPAPGE